MKFVWKVYIIRIFDYCSQLWGPQNGGLLIKLENLQSDFTSRISGMKSLSYWERLDKLEIYSINRRIERYRIIYSRKILYEYAPNCGLSWDKNETKGTFFNIVHSPNDAPLFAKTIRNNSFQYQGPTLFNILPRYIRDNQSDMEDWKIV